MKIEGWFKSLSIGVLASWLLLLALMPILLVVIASFLTVGTHDFFIWRLTFHNYAALFNLLYVKVFFRSFELAFVTTITCLILGYPFAYIMSRLPERMRFLCMFLLVVPFWTNSLIRLYAIITIIRGRGLLNTLLLHLHLIDKPITLLYTQTAVLIGLIYTLLPFMILPLYANLEKFDWRLLMAARDLGANRFQIFRRILLPLTIPGIVGGVMLVFLPAMTIFYIPDVLGGAKSLLWGNLIKNEFIDAYHWPMGSTVSIVLTLLLGLMILIYWKVSTVKDRQTLV